LEHSESQAIKCAITAETERRRKVDSVSKTAVSILPTRDVSCWKEEKEEKKRKKES
jgi:hypothetical protein